MSAHTHAHTHMRVSPHPDPTSKNQYSVLGIIDKVFDPFSEPYFF